MQDKLDNKRTTQQELQQYFTNDILAEYVIRYSSIIDNKNKIEVLEPTAGQGALIQPLLKLVKTDMTIDLCEIDTENRKVLMQFENTAPDIIHLMNEKNFLKFIPSKRYDYIFMNPPFHLKKSTNALQKRDIWDFDFIKRAFAMLNVGGELIGITSKHWTFAENGKMKKGNPLPLGGKQHAVKSRTASRPARPPAVPPPPC
jgi:predicted RNA methylase